MSKFLKRIDECDKMFTPKKDMVLVEAFDIDKILSIGVDLFQKGMTDPKEAKATGPLIMSSDLIEKLSIKLKQLVGTGKLSAITSNGFFRGFQFSHKDYTVNFMPFYKNLQADVSSGGLSPQTILNLLTTGMSAASGKPKDADAMCDIVFNWTTNGNAIIGNLVLSIEEILKVSQEGLFIDGVEVNPNVGSVNFLANLINSYTQGLIQAGKKLQPNVLYTTQEGYAKICLMLLKACGLADKINSKTWKDIKEYLNADYEDIMSDLSSGGKPPPIPIIFGKYVLLKKSEKTSVGQHYLTDMDYQKNDVYIRKQPTTFNSLIVAKSKNDTPLYNVYFEGSPEIYELLSPSSKEYNIERRKEMHTNQVQQDKSKKALNIKSIANRYVSDINSVLFGDSNIALEENNVRRIRTDILKKLIPKSNELSTLQLPAFDGLSKPIIDYVNFIQHNIEIDNSGKYTKIEQDIIEEEIEIFNKLLDKRNVLKTITTMRFEEIDNIIKLFNTMIQLTEDEITKPFNPSKRVSEYYKEKLIMLKTITDSLEFYFHEILELKGNPNEKNSEIIKEFCLKHAEKVNTKKPTQPPISPPKPRTLPSGVLTPPVTTPKEKTPEEQKAEEQTTAINSNYNDILKKFLQMIGVQLSKWFFFEVRERRRLQFNYVTPEEDFLNKALSKSDAKEKAIKYYKSITPPSQITFNVSNQSAFNKLLRYHIFNLETIEETTINLLTEYQNIVHLKNAPTLKRNDIESSIKSKYDFLDTIQFQKNNDGSFQFPDDYEWEHTFYFNKHLALTYKYSFTKAEFSQNKTKDGYEDDFDITMDCKDLVLEFDINPSPKIESAVIKVKYPDFKALSNKHKFIAINLSENDFSKFINVIITDMKMVKSNAVPMITNDSFKTNGDITIGASDTFEYKYGSKSILAIECGVNEFLHTALVSL